MGEELFAVRFGSKTIFGPFKSIEAAAKWGEKHYSSRRLEWDICNFHYPEELDAQLTFLATLAERLEKMVMDQRFSCPDYGDGEVFPVDADMFDALIEDAKRLGGNGE